MSEIVFVGKPIFRSELKTIAERRFGDLVKGVVDIQKEVMALGGELHADEEAFLLQQGSQQVNLWGINLYPELSLPDMLEFDSMINIRPSQNNKTRGVESEETRERIREIVTKLIVD